MNNTFKEELAFAIGVTKENELTPIQAIGHCLN